MRSRKVADRKMMERAEAEMRSPRLARAVIAAHIGWRQEVRERGAELESRERLRVAIEALEQTVADLTELHPLRMAAEHAAYVHARWAEDPESEALAIALACALLSRVLEETSYAFGQDCRAEDRHMRCATEEVER